MSDISQEDLTIDNQHLTAEFDRLTTKVAEQQEWIDRYWPALDAIEKERDELREALMRIRHAVRNDHPLHALDIADTALANLNKPASEE